MRNYNTLKPRVYKYKMWKYGYHKRLNKFIFEPLQMLLEKEGIELEPYEKWEFLQNGTKNFHKISKLFKSAKCFYQKTRKKF